MNISDEHICRYLDNELDAAERAEFNEQLAVDTELKHRVAQFSAVSEQARQWHQKQLEQPVPEHLIQAVHSAQMPSSEAPTDQRVQADRVSWRQRIKQWFAMPSAGLVFASVAMLASGVLIGVGMQSGSERPGFLAMEGAIQAGTDFDARLSSAASGTRITEGQYQVDFLASFVGEDGRFCREYQVERQSASARIVVGIACRKAPDTAWQIVFAIDEAFEQSPQSDYYVTASERLLEAVDAYVREHIGTRPLSPEQERAIIDINGAIGQPISRS